MKSLGRGETKRNDYPQGHNHIVERALGVPLLRGAVVVQVSLGLPVFSRDSLPFWKGLVCHVAAQKTAFCSWIGHLYAAPCHLDTPKEGGGSVRMGTCMAQPSGKGLSFATAACASVPLPKLGPFSLSCRSSVHGWTLGPWDLHSPR